MLISTGAGRKNTGGRALARFLYYQLPLTLPGIIVGTVLAFARSPVNLAQPSPLCRTFLVKRGPSFCHVYPDPDPWRGKWRGETCIISIALAMISLLISEWLAKSAVSGRGANHAGTEFFPDVGNHCLTINETLPANGITAILVSLVPEKPR